MKIEDLKYTFPKEPVDIKGYNKEQWLKDNPIDYFKHVYLFLSVTQNPPMNIPYHLLLGETFKAIYAVIRLYIPDTLYKFCSLSDAIESNKKKFDTLRNRQIYMSHIKDFNDPFDGKAFFYDPKQLAEIKNLEHVKGKIIKDFTSFIRCAALTGNNINCMPMWAHYSNNHQGFCVEYDMKTPANVELAGCTFPMQYTDERLDITSFMKKYVSKMLLEVNAKMDLSYGEHITYDLSLIYIIQYLYNIKHSTWKYEREFRCIIGADAVGSSYINAVPKAIYIGMNCCKQNKEELIKIAKELDVPIYQMQMDELSEDYSLKEVAIEY